MTIATSSQCLSVFAHIARGASLSLLLTIAAQAEPQVIPLHGSKSIAASTQETPSAETTPVTFSVDGVTYRVPRNYIVHMFNWGDTLQKDGSPLLKVTFPGFEPLSDSTKECVSSGHSHASAGCVPLDFWIGGRSQLVREQAAKTSTIFHTPRDPSVIKQGPTGYQFVEMPISANMMYRIYFKETGDHPSSLSCLIPSGAANGKQDATCKRETVASNGGVFQYNVSLNGLEDIEQIDSGLSTLVNSFTRPEAHQ